MIDTTTLEARIRELKAEREDFLAQANAKSGELAGRIAECERMLAGLKQEMISTAERQPAVLP
jgi:vacuolar-type H+-ATPase subunit H